MRIAVQLLTLCILLAMAPTLAQETASAADSVAQAKEAYGEAGEAFRRTFQEIETLRGEFQNADAGRRQEIDAKLPELLQQAESQMQTWVNAAIELYSVAPNDNQQLADWLVGMAEFYSLGRLEGGKQPSEVGGRYAGGDQYELALPIIKLLIDNSHPKQDLLLWGGVSAVCVNDFDLAEEYLSAANEAGLFSGLPFRPTGQEPVDVAFAMKGRDYYANLDQMRANWEAEEKIRDTEAAADDLPRVKFTTTKGDIVIELFENEAPIATANVVSLVKDGFYSDVVFHRVLPHFMAQGGDPTGSGSGGPGYNIECECYEPDARKHFRGSLSMAHAGRDTGGSQFFMCFVPTDFLNGRHTAFGRVVEGIEVLGKLQRIDPQAKGARPTPDKIIKAEVLRDRGHAYDFEKRPGR